MGYQLELTREERAAMDWIGDRYFHGHDLAMLLSGLSEVDWESDETIDYRIPEHVAWAWRAN
jgi:hypothetical protein